MLRKCLPNILDGMIKFALAAALQSLFILSLTAGLFNDSIFQWLFMLKPATSCTHVERLIASGWIRQCGKWIDHPCFGGVNILPNQFLDAEGGSGLSWVACVWSPCFVRAEKVHLVRVRSRAFIVQTKIHRVLSCQFLLCFKKRLRLRATTEVLWKRKKFWKTFVLTNQETSLLYYCQWVQITIRNSSETFRDILVPK